MYKRRVRAKGLMRKKNYLTRVKTQEMFIDFMEGQWGLTPWYRRDIKELQNSVYVFSSFYKNALKGYSGNVKTLCEDTIKEFKMNKLLGL
jgi:hypothetical protein